MTRKAREHPLLNRLLSLEGGHLDPRRFFHSDEYLRSTARRLEHLASLRLPLHGLSVLEVGAGIGDLSHFYTDRGCDITITEGRPANLAHLRKRYPGRPVVPLDLDHPQASALKAHQVIHCYGLLYHLCDPEGALDFLSSICSEMLLLETCVSFGDSNDFHFLPEAIINPTQAISGTGCRPTRNAVRQKLAQSFEYVYIPRSQPNHEDFPLDWTAPEKHQGKYARAVFVASRRPLDSPELISCRHQQLPSLQSRAD